MKNLLHTLPVRHMLCGLLLFGAAKGVCMEPIPVVQGEQTFAVPFYGLNTGTCFQVISSDARWQWSNTLTPATYTGALAFSASAGTLTGIPLPEGVPPGVYALRVQIGFEGGGRVCWSEEELLQVEVIRRGETVTERLCSGQELIHALHVASGQQPVSAYRWSRADVEGIRESGASGATQEIREVLTNTTHRPIWVQYRCSVETAAGPEAYTLSVLVQPNIRFRVEGVTALCSGAATALAILPADGSPAWPDGVNFTWTAQGTGVSGMEDGSGQRIEQTLSWDGMPGTVVYTVRPEEAREGCSEAQTVTVTVLELPEIALSGRSWPATVSFGTPLVLEAVPAVYPAYRFVFNGTATEQASPELLLYDWISDGANEASVTVSDANGCPNTAFATLTGPRMGLLNAFTPDGDGINDRLYPGFDLEVFNGNGVRMYRGNEGWDGTYRGHPVPSGTYLYIVTHDTPEGGKAVRKYHVFVKAMR